MVHYKPSILGTSIYGNPHACMSISAVSIRGVSSLNLRLHLLSFSTWDPKLIKRSLCGPFEIMRSSKCHPEVSLTSILMHMRDPLLKTQILRSKWGNEHHLMTPEPTIRQHLWSWNMSNFIRTPGPAAMHTSSFGGFLKMGVPISWMVYKGKSHKNAWFGGTAISGNLKLILLTHWLYWLSPVPAAIHC